MAYAAGDWTIDRQTKNIRYIGGDHNSSPTYATVIEAHRAWQDLADDAVSVTATGDELDITDGTPSERSTDNIITLINGYNIDDGAAEHLYNGSIIQGSGVTETIYDGIVNFGNADVQVQIHQNGAVLADDWWNFGAAGLNADAANGISHRFMIKVRDAGADIDGRRLIGQARRFGFSYQEFKINGTARGNNVFALADATDLNNQTTIGTVAAWTNITNVTEGYKLLDVNNDTTDEAYYSEWNRDTQTINDLYERAKWLSREGSASTIYGLNGELFRGITHQVTVDTPTGTFSAFEAISWTGGTGQMLAINSPTAGTLLWMQLLTGVAPTDGQVITGGTSAATVTVNVTVTDRVALLTRPFIGQSTGSALIGGYGVGVETLDLSASDKLFDLTNAQITPPNNVTFTVSGLVNTEDRVYATPLGHRFFYDAEATGPFTIGETLTFTSPAGTAKLAELYDNGTVGQMYIGEILTGTIPADNSTIAGATATAVVNGPVSNDTNLRQLTLNGLLNGATVTSVVVTETIPADTPSTGDIRIKRTDGNYTEHAYSAWSGSTFTITSTDFSTNTAPDDTNVYISYLDLVATGATAAFTGVFTANRNIFIRVRDGGGTPIKTFESTGTLTSAGGSSTAIRTSDS